MMQPPKDEKYPPVLFRGANAENRVTLPAAKFNETEDPTRLVYCVIPITCVILFGMGSVNL